MFQHDCLDTYCFECLICMCLVFLYLHLFSATEHVSHGKALWKYAHYYYSYYCLIFVRFAWQKCNIQDYMQTSTPNSFIPALLVSTIDLYYYMSLSVTLTLIIDHKVSSTQNLLASFLSTIFN